MITQREIVDTSGQRSAVAEPLIKTVEHPRPPGGDGSELF